MSTPLPGCGVGSALGNRLVLGVLAAAALLAVGCAGGSRSPGAVSGVVLGAESPATAPLEVGDAYPRIAAGETAELRYRITDGQDAGQTAVLALNRCEHLRQKQATAADADDNRLCLRWTIEGESRERNTRLWSRAGSGLIVMGLMLNPEREVVTSFDPPLAIFPKELIPGEAFTQDVRMTVTDSNGRPKEQGRARLEMTLEADQELTLGGTRLQAQRVRTVFRADLRRARIVRTTQRWHVAGFGPVLEQFEEEVRAFGLVVERTRQTFVIEDAAAAARGAD